MDRREYIKNTGLILGYSITFGTAASIMNSCKQDHATLQSNEIFSSEQRQLLEELTETIIPKTNTPGAKDTNCAAFIEKLVKDIYNEKDRADFLKGLNEIDSQCKSVNGKIFLESNKEQRESFLSKLDKESPKFPPKMWGIVLIKNTEPVGFFRHLKAATLMAYFTSQELSEFNKRSAAHG